MRFAIHTEPGARSLTEQRLRLGLSRYAPRISGVQVWVEHDGVHARRCELTVRLDDGEVVQVLDHDVDLVVVLDRACERAGRSIERNLRKLH